MYQCRIDEKHAELDDYTLGVLPGDSCCCSMDLAFKAETLPGLFQKIAEFFDVDLENIEAINGDNFIWISRMETDAGEKATKGDIERFKHEKQRLWLANYWGEVTRMGNVTETEMQAALNKEN